MFLLLLSACELLNPEKVGIYGCDEYCEQLISKADECATEQGVSLDEYAASVDPDWEGQGKTEITASCNEKLAESGKSEAECKASTGTFNNLGCDDIISLLEQL